MNRPQPPAIFQANLGLVAAIVIGLLLATVLGFTVGASEIIPIALMSASAVIVLFVAGLYRYIWQIALFLLFFFFSYRPTSFSFGPLEISCALGAGVIALFIWQKSPRELPAILTEGSFIFLRRALFIWLLYVALHMVYNIVLPYRPSEFSLNNSIKSYFAVSAPFLLLFYFGRSPRGLVVRKDFYWTISRLCFLGLLINLGVRFYQLVGGGTAYIPIIKATSDVYALRTLGPLSMMLGTIGITAPAGRKTLIRYVTYWLLLLLGAAGCSVSAGRITLLIGFLMVCAVLVIRRKVGALFLVVIVGILGAAIANLSADWINSQADPFVQRSLQWILIHKKGSEALTTIEGSSNWRRELFNRATDEWRSDPRIFWTGRATYGFGVADETALLISGGYEAIMDSALRRGTTHNLISDLLLIYGVIGLVLYLAVYTSIILFLWKLYRMRSLSPPAANLTLACLVGSLSWFVYSVVGGNFYSIEYVWFLIVLIGALYSGAGIEERAAATRLPFRSSSAPTQIPNSRRRLVRAIGE
ncbi:MAG: hypothetical protein ACR2HH_16110 [Chthoniobacterales bacterium]